jgi:hypothetical protein
VVVRGPQVGHGLCGVPATQVRQPFPKFFECRYVNHKESLREKVEALPPGSWSAHLGGRLEKDIGRNLNSGLKEGYWPKEQDMYSRRLCYGLRGFPLKLAK